MCKNNVRWWLIALAIVISCSVSHSRAAGNSSTHNNEPIIQQEGLSVKQQGTGPAVVFVPGLNSGDSVFKNTCEAIKHNHRCYLVQLAGFAGAAPLGNYNQDFLSSRSKMLAAFIRNNKLGKVTLVGHSLGGTLSLIVAQESPELVRNLVIMDALPFYSAIQNPAATVDSMRPQAEYLRSMMLNQSQEDYLKYGTQNLMGLSNNPQSVQQLTEWLQTSDRATTAAAIYSMMITDLRKSIAKITTPVMVLGSWAAYRPMGATQESTRAIFTQQYAALKNVDIRMSETGYHFLMWDDADWVNRQLTDFIK